MESDRHGLSNKKGKPTTSGMTRTAAKRTKASKKLFTKLYIVNETHSEEVATKAFEREEKQLAIRLNKIENLNGGRKIVARGFVSARKYLKAIQKQKLKSMSIETKAIVNKSPIKKVSPAKQKPQKMEKDTSVKKEVKKEKTSKKETKEKPMKKETKEKPVKITTRKQGVVKKIDVSSLMSQDNSFTKQVSVESVDFTDSENDVKDGMNDTIGSILANLNTPCKSTNEKAVVDIQPISYVSSTLLSENNTMHSTDVIMKSCEEEESDDEVIEVIHKDEKVIVELSDQEEQPIGAEKILIHDKFPVKQPEICKLNEGLKVIITSDCSDIDAVDVDKGNQTTSYERDVNQMKMNEKNDALIKG